MKAARGPFRPARRILDTDNRDLLWIALALLRFDEARARHGKRASTYFTAPCLVRASPLSPDPADYSAGEKDASRGAPANDTVEPLAKPPGEYLPEFSSCQTYGEAFARRCHAETPSENCGAP